MNIKTWGIVALCSVMSLALISGANIALGASDPNLESAYDGADPFESECAFSVDEQRVVELVPITGLNGAELGTAQLRYSVQCGTAWVKVVIDPTQAFLIADHSIRIAVIRDADDKQVQYELQLDDQPEGGFGHMLSDSDACVRGEVVVLNPDGVAVSSPAEVPCEE